MGHKLCPNINLRKLCQITKVSSSVQNFILLAFSFRNKVPQIRKSHLAETFCLQSISILKLPVTCILKDSVSLQPTCLPIVPPLLKFLVESGDITSEDLRSTRQVVIGAAPVPKTSAMKLQEKTKEDVKFQEGWLLASSAANQYFDFVEHLIIFFYSE